MATIGVDIDGILADFNTSYVSLINKMTGIEFPPLGDDYPDEWFYCKTAYRKAGYDEDQVNAVSKVVWSTIAASKSFWLDLKPYPGAVKFLQWISLLKDDVYFMTSRPGATAKWQTEKWLKRNGFFGAPTVIITSDKDLVCKAVKADYYVDDKTENCEDVLMSCPALVYMVERPYNTPLKDLTGRGPLDGFRKLIEMA